MSRATQRPSAADDHAINDTKNDFDHGLLAADDMSEAIRLASESPVNYHRRGACWFHLGDYQKAYDDLTVAIGKEPGKPDHYDNRAQTLERMGRSDDAEKDLKKARELRGQ
jgi:tetratricopeptide (TPR) repeat protein